MSPTSNNFISKLQEAINGEASAIRFYGQLLTQVRNRTEYDNVKHAFDDENQHFRTFVQLYTQLTGTNPKVEIKPVRYRSLSEAFRHAFFDELEASELYQEMYLMTNDPAIRDIFYKTQHDEAEHAQRFNFLYNEAIRNGY